MAEETWKGIIIRSIPTTSKWLPVIPSLYALTNTPDVFSTLIAHGMILDPGKQSKPTMGSSTNTALVARTVDACTNPNCKAKKRSTHSTANCYWPGGGKEGQFPPNFGQRARANVASTTQSANEHFVLSARIADSPGNSGVVIEEGETNAEVPNSVIALVSQRFQGFNGGKVPTFIDSGASDTMFVSKEDFGDYKSMIW